jgi:adenylate cyclase
LRNTLAQMTIPEEIEQLKIKLENTVDERKQAKVLVEMLEKYTSTNSADSQLCIEDLLQLAEKLNEPLYRAWGEYHLAVLKLNTGEFDASLDLGKQALYTFNQYNNREGIAACYNVIGNGYNYKDNYSAALKNHFAALRVREEIGDKQGAANSHTNIGNTYRGQGNYPEALKSALAALKLGEEIGNPHSVARSYNNIGLIYDLQGNFPEALKNHFASLRIQEKLDDKQGMAASYDNIGVIYTQQRNYPEALKSHFAALKLEEETSNKKGIAGCFGNIGIAYCEQGNFPEALKNHLAAAKLQEEIGSKADIAGSYKNIGDVFFQLGKHQEALKNLLFSIKVSEEIGFKELIKESTLLLTTIYKATNDFENALKYHEKYHKIESEMLGEQAQKQLTQLNFTHNMEQKEKDLEIEQLRNVELKKEKDRSEALLLNILPSEVAEELKNKGSADAKLFDDVTVLYTDFKSFTTVTERLTPKQLLDELNTCFSAFDEIMERYKIEKIKTVGDAYLAVSGLPLANSSHASDVINAAIEIREFIKERKQLMGDNTFDIRIGVHSGSVVAGIVGVKKFAYDIWGDTVNTAARMEQNSEAGKINISEATYQLVKDSFNCKYRGEIEAKNKGKMKMYFVAG